MRARPRLLASAAVGLALALAMPSRPSARFIAGWDVGVGLYLALSFAMVATSSHAALQKRADEEDAGASAVLALTALAAAASLLAIAAELHGIRENPGAVRPALAAVTILLSWFFVNTIFAFHYAHDYYAGEQDREGLGFPGGGRPDYWDFLYFAFTIGAAAQTSDVSIETGRMRRFVLAHTILSFLFNTTVLALAINVGASLI